MNNTPLVSVLMTAYNRHKYIGEAIESVLASTYQNFELIIVDDCSSDDTVAIANSYREKDSRIKVYINEINLGDYNNRNRSAEYATGVYIKYLDSDDTIYPQALQLFVEGMETFPNAAVGIMSGNGDNDAPYPYLMQPKESFHYNFYEVGLFDKGPSALIFRTDKFREVGGFSGKRFVGDLEMNLKMASKWPVVKLPPSLIYWRQHEGQELFLGMASTGYLENQLPVLEEAFKNPECPLSQLEQKQILEYFRKISAREIIKIAFVRRSPVKAFEIYRKLLLRLSDFINAIFFMKKGIQ